MKYKICYPLQLFFGWLSKWAGDREWQFAFCPDCGRNRYSGKPCKGVTNFDNHILDKE